MASRAGSPIITAMLVLHTCHIVRKEMRRNGFSVLLTQTAKPSVSLVPGGDMEADENTRLLRSRLQPLCSLQLHAKGKGGGGQVLCSTETRKTDKKKALWLSLQSVYQPLF